jgi:predicted transcriptional regulator
MPYIYIAPMFRVSGRDTTRQCEENKMDDYLKEALEIVKAQASVRNMTEEEITSMVKKVAEGIRGISEGVAVVEEGAAPSTDPKKAIKEKSVTCLECGKVFKIITKKHLATHGLTADEYRAKHGYKKGTPLVSKSLQRERRTKMKDMKLWEKRKKAK